MKIFACLAVLLASGSAKAESLLKEIRWIDLEREDRLIAGKVDGTSLEVENRDPEAVRLAVLVLDSPGIESGRYALRGEVRYEGVEGPGFLEMWVHFTDGGSCSSRTRGDEGPRTAWSGFEDWHPFVLPFGSGRANGSPERLSVQVGLPGRGKVHLSPLRLVEYAPDEDPLGGDPCRAEATGGFGAVAGLVSGRFEAAPVWMGGGGKARQIVLGGIKILAATGAACLVLGVWALARFEPLTSSRHRFTTGNRMRDG